MRFLVVVCLMLVTSTSDLFADGSSPLDKHRAIQWLDDMSGIEQTNLALMSYGSQKISARFPVRLVTRSDDGYVALTLLREEPSAPQRAVYFRDPYHSETHAQPRDLVIASVLVGLFLGWQGSLALAALALPFQWLLRFPTGNRPSLVRWAILGLTVSSAMLLLAWRPLLRLLPLSPRSLSVWS